MSIPLKVRRLLREREGNVCAKCGERAANNAHHRKNRSQGGKDVLSNLLLLCGSGTTGCHGWVTENPRTSYLLGFSVKSWGDPASTPVFYRGQLLFLDDAGNLVEKAA
jgi:hypothetical protein